MIGQPPNRIPDTPGVTNMTPRRVRHHVSCDSHSTGLKAIPRMKPLNGTDPRQHMNILGRAHLQSAAGIQTTQLRKVPGALFASRSSGTDEPGRLRSGPAFARPAARPIGPRRPATGEGRGSQAQRLRGGGRGAIGAADGRSPRAGPATAWRQAGSRGHARLMHEVRILEFQGSTQAESYFEWVSFSLTKGSPDIS